MKYAGNSYGGQIASVGRVVVTNYDDTLVAGHIESIDDDGVPMLSFYGVAYRAAEDAEYAEHVSGQYFVPTKTVEEIETLPKNAWTWPVCV